MAEEYKKKRTTAKSQFTRYANRLQKALDLEDCDAWTLEARFKDFKDRWERVEEAHDAYVVELSEEDAEGEAVWLDDLLDTFDDLELKVGKKMCEAKKESKQNTDPPQESSSRVEQAAIQPQERKTVDNQDDLLASDVAKNEKVAAPMQVPPKPVDKPEETTKQEVVAAKGTDQALHKKSVEEAPKAPMQENKVSTYNSDYSLFSQIPEASDRATNQIQLERIKLHKFSGDMRKYPEFKEDFAQQVEPKCSMSQRAFVLKHYLSDEVREEVSNVSDDYRAMWRRLDQKYGNVRRLVEMHLAEVKGISPKDTSDESVLKMINVVERAHRNLQRLGQHKELYNLTTISIIEQAMTKEMSNEWIRTVTRTSCSSVDGFLVLLDFLTMWRDRLEYQNSAIREPKETKDVKRTGFSNHVGSTSQRDNGPKKHPCWLHKAENEDDTHPIWVCKRFLEMDTKERREVAVKNKACLRCLLTTCAGAANIEKCNRSFKCPVYGCRELHNKLLHMDRSKSEAQGASLHAGESRGNEASDTILPIQTL